MFHFSTKAAGRLPGSLGIMFFSGKCPPIWKTGGSFGCSSLGLCFTFQPCRHSACGVVVIAGKSSGYGVLGKCITLACRGANHDNLEGCTVPGGISTTRCGGLEVGRHGRRLVTEKNANTMFAFFSSSLPTATAVGCSSPFEALKDGFATGAWPHGLQVIFRNAKKFLC